MRQKIMNRRPSENHTVEFSGIPIEVSLGRDPDRGSVIREVFVTTRKLGSAVDIMARDITILMSFLLQYGCDMTEVVDVLTSDDHGNPEGVAGLIAALIIKESKEDGLSPGS